MSPWLDSQNNMTERGLLSLCSSPFNGEQAVVFKSAKATRRIEAAGFAFFLTREWQLEVAFEDVFEPRHVSEVCEATIRSVEAYLENAKSEQQDAKYTFGLKTSWAQLLVATKETTSQSERWESSADDVPKLGKSNSRKCLGLVRDFVAKNQNAYELLNVCDSDDITKIKANYKKIVLLLHPDKAGHTRVPEDMVQYANKYRLRSLCEEERKQQFLLLQDAFTIMSDHQLRHEYDCSLPFDETIPSREDAKASGKPWSRTKPVPSLGGESSSDDDVDAFYDFWSNFETTRTFSHAAPHLLDDAESREEKRWMERENLKVQRKLVKKELLRIQKLVDLAQAFDPRLKARAERRRLAKIERQRQMEEERLRERREREEAEARQRDELERCQNRERLEKQIVKKLRQHIRATGGKVPNGVALSQNFDRLSELDYAFVKHACEEIYGLLGHATVIEGSEDSLQFVKRMDAVVKAATIVDAVPFEVVLQRVASQIAPPPASDSQETPVPKQNEKEECPVQWSSDELSRLSKAVELHVAGVSDRWSLIAKHVKTKSAAQCIQMAREVASGKRVDSTTPRVNIANGVHGDLWTPEQQSEFEAALAKYPTSLDPATRWRMIASEVEGKTPKECLSRFKMIKATLAAAATRN
ncbi:DnaJ domain-containing protein [Babesia caballi]|uniref:DnaJ homolog subfamily C member 2 n=1 Tax=Babesia caballi TaxID=5871 RepID=A0AAV4LXI7_BABCB|nr:DnaJ domain-containing protein [Babesia caballi]